jgi:hypothetical protein
MRNPLLCALALLCGAGVVHGQPGSNGYYQSGASTGFGAPVGYRTSSGYSTTGYDANAAAFRYNAFLGGNAVQPNYCPPMPPSPPTASVDAADADELTPHDEPECKHCFWIGASYAALFIKPERIATPLTTVGSAADASPGALGQPGTIVMSPDKFNFGMLSGVQTDAGLFLTPDGCVAVQWTTLYVSPGHSRYALASDATGSPIIARPLFNVNSGMNAGLVDSIPGSLAGTMLVDARTALFGTECNLTCRWTSTEESHFDLLAGTRFLHLSEDLTMMDQLTPLVPGFLTFEGGPANPPNTIVDMDKFRTTNNFYGLQLGGLYGVTRERLFLAAYGKAGLGITSQLVNINGSTALVSATGRQYAAGGVLALPSNMGQYSRNVLGFVPEAGLTLGINVTSHVQLTMGYSFLYWNSVVRPAAQINSAVNPTQIPTLGGFGTAFGPPSPTFQFVPESFWMHNVNCGLAVHF